MTRSLALAAALFLAAPAATGQPLRGPPNEVQLSVGREGEYDGLKADLGLEGEQLARFDAALAERRQRLEAFVDGPDGQRLIELRTRAAQARRAGKIDEASELRREQMPLAEAYLRLRNECRVAILNTLTPEQQKRAAGFALYQRLERHLARAEPTDEQRRRVRTIADETAAAWLTPEVLAADPFFLRLSQIQPRVEKRVAAEVLTAEQRGKLPRRRPATTPATRPATTTEAAAGEDHDGD